MTKPGWKVLRALAEQFKLDSFDFTSSEAIRDIVKKQADGILKKVSSSYDWPKQLPIACAGLERIVEWPIYQVDGIVRRSQPLQQSATNELTELMIQC